MRQGARASTSGRRAAPRFFFAMGASPRIAESADLRQGHARLQPPVGDFACQEVEAVEASEVYLDEGPLRTSSDGGQARGWTKVAGGPRKASADRCSLSMISKARTATFKGIMASNELHADLYGWWRITETSQWVNDGLDDLGPAMISMTGHADRLRMHCLLANVNVMPTKTGALFTWAGAWEYDQMSGTGGVKLGKDGRLRGRIKIKDGDESTFIAERTTEPAEPIPDPPSYREKRGPRRRQ